VSEDELLDMGRRLFEAIAHGDEEHRAWLKQAIEKFFREEAQRDRSS
jgi:hypothetical protein